jgi:RecJ-like exonuclease
MKICKKCGSTFQSSAWVEGKRKSLTTRSYCLNCSPYGKYKGYEIRKSNSNSPKEKQCPICARVFNKTKNNVCSTCRGVYLRWKHKSKALEYLGGKCHCCGITDPDVLVFHHNANNKTFELADAWANTSWDIIQLELDKCIILCNNCHIKLHVQEYKTKFNQIVEYYETKSLNFPVH